MNLLIPLLMILTTYCTPYHNAEGALVQLLQSTKNECLVAVYTINSPILVNTLITLHHHGKHVEVITDSTQAAGSHEAMALQYLRGEGIPVYVGRSVDHQIMHTKFCVVDDESVALGSFNWTDVANKQDNTLTIEDNPQLAKQLHAYWDQIKKDLQ
jgi:phosphatidylserine/phosphatidylglycerophosphate/cardiolipin synthase-like enzyme